MEDTLASQLTALANNLRNKYNKTGGLTIADMVRLTTPPPIKDGTVLATAGIGQGISYGNHAYELDIRLKDPFPDLGGAKIKLVVSFGEYTGWYSGNNSKMKMISEDRTQSVISDPVVRDSTSEHAFNVVFHISNNIFSGVEKFHFRSTRESDYMDISGASFQGIKIYNDK